MKLVSTVLAAILPAVLVRGDGEAPAAVHLPLADDVAAAGFGFDREFSPMPPAPGSDARLPASWVRFLDQKAAYDEAREDELDLLEGAPPLRNAPPTGRYKVLVLLMKFADDDVDDLPTQQEMEVLYNTDSEMNPKLPITKATGDIINPTGSIHDVWKMNSAGALNLNAYVTPWITMAHNTKYYASDASGVGEYGRSKSRFEEGCAEALNKFAPTQAASFWDQFDYDSTTQKMDGFGVIHSGHGAEYGGTENEFRIWSIKGSGIDWTVPGAGGRTITKYYTTAALYGYQGTQPLRMGTACHEIGHSLGVPDLYDTSFAGEGLGNYDLMAYGNLGFDNAGWFPSHLSAWTKVEMGWANPNPNPNLVINAGTAVPASGRQYTIVAGENQVYEIGKGMFGQKAGDREYFLLENRQPIGYDSAMPQEDSGIAIYHIDEKGKQNKAGYPGQSADKKGRVFPDNKRHYMDAMVASDGNFALEEGTTKTVPLWHSGSQLKELRPGGNSPNTDGYFKGTETHTGIRLYDFSASNMTMTFKVAFNVPAPTPASARLRGPAAHREIG